MAPLPAQSIRLINYIAFGRRIVTAVIPPEKNDGPTFKSTFYRLRTAPAPWSIDERWREPGAMVRSDIERDAEQDEPESPEVHELPTFELEEDTIAEPDVIDIWVNGNELGIEGDGSWLVGLGLRARWAQIGVDEERSWWIARLKDCKFRVVA